MHSIILLLSKVISNTKTKIKPCPLAAKQQAFEELNLATPDLKIMQVTFT